MAASRKDGTERLTARVQLLGQTFEFKLLTRPVSLGQSRTAQYFWMDNSQFRNINSDASAENFRCCLGHWWTAMRATGLADDVEQQAHYITAQCYPLFCRNKTLQLIYRDAFLAPKNDGQSDIAVPDDVRERILDIVKARDANRVREELDRILGRFDVPTKVLPPLQEAFRHWVGKGVTLMRKSGHEGIFQFLKEVKYWHDTYRKKSGGVWVRHFINLFAHEAKISFHRCFANAWVDLIPWLRENRKLDLLSERFLRFWHNQNQPVEIPRGQTAGGVLYPTRRGAILVGRGDSGAGDRQSVAWETEQIGPTHIRDAFNGQVLSLHPISGFIMRDPAMCEIAGEYFGMDDYDEIASRGQLGRRPEYWRLVGVIMLAASKYGLAREAQENARGRRKQIGSETLDGVAHDAAPPPETLMWDDYAAERQIRCKSCGSKLRFDRREAPKKLSETATIYFRCAECSESAVHRVCEADLASFLGCDNSRRKE